MIFETPWLLFLAPVVALAAAAGVWIAWRRRVALAADWSPALARVARTRGRWGPVALGLVTLLALVALAGPRGGRASVTTETRALSMVLAIDISRSMLAEDVRPSRLQRAVREARRLVQDSPGDRVGLIDPRTAASTAKAYGIRVYTIGVGTIGEAPIPTGRGVGGFRYEMMPVRIDEPLMREIAHETGAVYFRATDAEALSQIFQKIDQLEKTPIQITRFSRHDESTEPLILFGLFALALELLLGATVLVRVP